MLKKLTALSLSLLLCLPLLPSQAGAMDASEDEQPVQAENLGSSENGDADAAPCTVVSSSEGGIGSGGPGLPPPRPSGNGAGDQDGSGHPWGSHPVSSGIGSNP